MKFYEFFAGAGMVRYALQPEWTCAWANDYDGRKVRLYRHNFGAEELDPRDVASIAAEITGRAKVTSDSSTPKFPLGVDMAWASFPCQDLSLAGWQRGMAANRSGTYWSFYEIMSALLDKQERPPLVVIENVAGLLYGENFRGLCESLAALHMNFGALLIDAKYFLPQSRPRVFVIAVDDRIDTRDLEMPASGLWHTKAIDRAQGELPPDLATRWKWWHLPMPTEPHLPVASLMEKRSTANRHSQAEAKRVLGMMSPKNRARVNAARSSEKTQFGFLYKRTRDGVQRAEVRFDGVAGCLRTPRGGSSRQTVLAISRKTLEMRLLTPIEAARLMGLPLDKKGRLPASAKAFFPDDFSYNEAYLAMGDGVVVPVVRHLDKHLLRPLAARIRGTSDKPSFSSKREIRWREASDARMARWAQTRAETK